MTWLFKTRIRVGLAAVLVLALLTAVWLFWPQAPRTPEAGVIETASAERGAYMAKIGNCQTCHTRANGEAYAGGLEFHTPFGLIHSTNITPEPDTGIGAWSFEAFHAAMTSGQRPDGAHLYPAFPYTAYAKMSDQDIADIYVYLQTLEPVRANATANALDFPFNLRLLLGPWKKLFHDTSPMMANDDQDDAWNRGAYLVEGPAHCSACHTPRNAFGAEKRGLAFAGGVYNDKVAIGKVKAWSAPNLTSHSTGLGEWSVDEISAYLTEGQNLRAVVHGPMNEVVINSTRHLTTEDADAMASYLATLPAKSLGSGKSPSKKQLEAGETVYTVHCGTCHLPTALGDPTLGVPLAGNAIVQAHDPSSLINVILYGPQLPPPPFVSDRTRMKAFGKRLSDEDIAAVSTYIRTQFGNQAGAVTAKQVNAQR